MPSEYSSWPEIPRSSSLTWVRKCIRVPFHQANHGLPAACCSRIQAIAASEVSSSITSIRSMVSGPVSSIVCVPSALAAERITPRGPKRSRKVSPFGSTRSRG